MSELVKSAAVMAEKQPTDQHIETVSGANTTTDVGSRSISAIEPYDLKDHAIVQDSDVQPLPEWWVAKYLPVSLPFHLEQCRILIQLVLRPGLLTGPHA